MKLRRFKDLSLFKKIAATSIVTIVLLVIAVALFIIPIVEKNVMNERRASLKNVVDLAGGILAKFEAQAAQGVMTREEAMEKAQACIKELRYGDGGKDYLWINDTGTPYPKMIMHPIAPTLDGTVLDNPKYNCAMGKDQNLFQAMVDVTKADGSGFVDYLWPKPGSDTAVEKLSYVKLYAPWNWIVGSGVYIDDVATIVNKMQYTIYAVILGTILISLIMTFFIARIISNSLGQGIEFAGKVANGDMTHTLDIDQEDEVGRLAGSLNTMVSKLGEMFSDMVRNSETLSAASTKFSALSDQLASASSDTNDQVISITAAVEEMNASVTSISASSEQSLMGVDVVSTAAQEMTTTISEISRNTDQANKTTKQAVEDVAKTLETINQLGDAADEIEKVTDTIYEISEQTNLLALNATIEAARAGEAGKGFAVVAAEIKDLATQTTNATGEIDRRVKAIQSSTRDAVEKINGISTVIHDLNDVVSVVTSSLREQSSNTEEIVKSVAQVHQGIQETNQNLAQLVESSNNISSDISNVSNSTDKSFDTSQQINSSAGDLSQMAASLDRALHRFKF